MVPYYQTALVGIRKYYRSSNNPSELAAARAQASALRGRGKKEHNLRVVESFSASRQARRKLQLVGGDRVIGEPYQDVEVRLQFDVNALERSLPVRIFYNTRVQAIDRITAETTLQLASWILDENGIRVPLRGLEFVDLVTKRTYSVSRVSPRVIRDMRATAKIIAALWPTV